MQWADPSPGSLFSIRPLVRYVDENQAVIEVRVHLHPPVPNSWDDRSTHEIDVHLDIASSQGFHDEHHSRLELSDHQGMVRYELVKPDRWWPAGLGDQSLYELTVRLIVGQETVGQYQTMIGLTSVRQIQLDQGVEVLVNGRVFTIQSVVPIDLPDEGSLLPAAGDSLLVVRGHYGPDVLYDAADRAGILMVQCVPIHPEAKPGLNMLQQINRLSAHPSLVGWFVGHLGDLTGPVSRSIRQLDPTRSVLTQLSGHALS